MRDAGIIGVRLAVAATAFEPKNPS